MLLKIGLARMKGDFKRNPLYWDNKNTIIEQATFLPISSETSDSNRYRSGEIDITSAIPPVLYRKMRQEQTENLHVTPYLCTFYYELNNKKRLLMILVFVKR